MRPIVHNFKPASVIMKVHPAALVLLVIAVFLVSDNKIATVIVALGVGAYFYLSHVSTGKPTEADEGCVLVSLTPALTHAHTRD